MLAVLLSGAVAALGADGDEPKLSFETTTLEGKSIDDSIMGKYDLVWVNVWAEWCGPCVSELPELQRIHEAYPNVLILGVWVGYDKEGALSTAENADVTYPLLNPDYDGSLYYYMNKADAIPASYFFDRDGKKIGEDYIGSRDYYSWKYIVDEMLTKIKPAKKPVIKKQPVSVTAKARQKVCFKVKAAGSGLRYQWYYRTSSRGKWKKVSGSAAKKAGYKFKAVIGKNKYQYRCCVKNSAGKVYSRAVKLKVRK